MGDSNSDEMQVSGRAKRLDRSSLVPVPFWTTPEARRQLRVLAAEEDTTQQKLIGEALNLLFARRNRETCA
jgi:hypothetical protein